MGFFDNREDRTVYCPECGAFMLKVEYSHRTGTNTCRSCGKRIKIVIDRDIESKTAWVESVELSPFQ